MGMTVIEVLIISFFLVTSLSCVVSCVGCIKVLSYYENTKKISKSISKLRRLDQYVLSKITLAIALFYFVIWYLYFNNQNINDFSFLFACIVSFIFNIITTFFSRISYCYVCNVILETKINEVECFLINFKNLFFIYLPFMAGGAVVPCIYLLNVSQMWHYILCVCAFILIVCVWQAFTPKIIAFSNRARKMKKNHMLRYRMEQLMKAHDIKKYELYYWDTSRSKEANAMVSGFWKCHLFISSYLIETVTLPELESIITHEIGHIKNNHLRKMIIGKFFMLLSIMFMIMVPYLLDFNEFYKVLFYVLTVFVGVAELIASIGIEKRYELEADSYANSYSDPNLFSSALKKVIKYDDEVNGVDSLFQTHPGVEERIKNVKKK